MPSFLQHNNAAELSLIASKLGEFDDKFPFLLFPVRIETRFMNIDHGTEVTWAYSGNFSVCLEALTDAREAINPVIQSGGPSNIDGRNFVNDAFNALVSDVITQMGTMTEVVISEKYKMEVEAGFLRSKIDLYTDQAIAERAAIQKKQSELTGSVNGAQTQIDDLPSALNNAAGAGGTSVPEGTWAVFTNHLQGLFTQIQNFNAEGTPTLDDRHRQAAEIAVHTKKLYTYLGRMTSIEEGEVNAAAGQLESLATEFAAFTEGLPTVQNDADALVSEYDTAISAMQDHQSGLEAVVEGLEGILIETGPGHIPDEISPGSIPAVEPVAAMPPIAHELWVRVYPDDIMIDRHEAELTQDEINAGETYWTEIWAYPNDLSTLENAWTKLTASYKEPRAAFIVKTTEPTNIANRPTGSPTFPSITATTNTLGTAAESRVMPDKFVVVVYDSMNAKLEWVGGPITDDPLICGIDPSVSNAYTWDLNGDLTVDPNIKWMFDFQEAYTKGMGIKVPMEDGFDEDGYKRLYVLGLRIDQGGSTQTAAQHAADGKADLAALIDSHHYSLDGFSVLPQGTPTNNTEEGVAGSKTEEFNERKLTSFEVEVSDPLFTQETDVKLKTDGQWLAEALGVDFETLEHIRHTNGYDVRDAMMMNWALWPSTAGFYLECLLDDLFMQTDMKDINRVRDFFQHYVSGRGFIPAIRVGEQPYGILATTAYSLWEQDTNWTGFNKKWHDDYQAYVTELENYYWKKWMDEDKISHIHKEPVGATSQEKLEDSQANFLNILGLNASSIEFYLRHGLSTGATGHILTVLQDIDPNMNTFTAGSNFQGIMDLFFYLKTSYPQLTTESTMIETVFFDEHLPLNGPLVDLYKPSETRTLRLVEGKNYIQHLLDASIMRVRANSFPAGVGDNSLLYLFLRKGYVQQYFDATTVLLDDLLFLDANPALAMVSFTLLPDDPVKNELAYVRIELSGGKVDDYPLGSVIRITGGAQGEEGNLGYYGVLGVSENPSRNVELVIKNPDAVAPANASAFLVAATVDYGYGTSARKDVRQYARNTYTEHNVNAGESLVSPWALMCQPVTGWVDFPTVPMEPGVYLEHYLENSNYWMQKQYLQQVKDALNILKTLTTADLERAFTEHLDLCTYRLDAWKQGIVNKRLRQNRASQSSGGIYLGAFAWVENLVPAPLEAVPSGELPPGYNTGSKLKRDPKNQGYIHAPSVAHATTAAVLRSGYNAYANDLPNEENIMAVNLSSERTRKAIYYMEGIRNGQNMESLLGYKFERALRDIGAVYNNHIATLREEFSMIIDPQEVSQGDIGKAEANVVINGLELIKAADNPGYPYGLSNLPTTGSTEANNIIAQVDQLKDDMDAVGDLAMADSVYNTVLGDFDQSTAMMDFLTKGKRPPESDVQEVNHKGKNLSHRVAMLLETVTTYTGTARQKAEPSVNQWLDRMLGNPDDIRIITYLDGSTSPTEYTLSAFNLAPIDFLYLLQEEVNSDDGSLTRFLARRIRQLATLSDTQTVELKYMERGGSWSIDVLSFGELIPLIERLHKMISDSSYLHQQHMELPVSSIVTNPPANPRELNETELRGRLDNTYLLANGGLLDIEDKLTDAASDLESTLSDANCNAVITELMRAFEYAVYQAIPHTAKTSSFDADDQEELLATASKTLSEIAYRAKLINSFINQVDNGNLGINLRVDRLTKALNTLFGGSFKVLPHFTLANATQMNDSIDILYPSGGGTFLPSGDLDPVGDWVHGMGRVRDRMKTFEATTLLADGFGMPRQSGVNWKYGLTPFQLYPALQNGASLDVDGNVNSDEYWLATEFPSTYKVAHDSLLLTLHYFGSGFDEPSDFTATDYCGIVVDEWTEKIPDNRVTTGISFHYDHPDSKAPQSMLLCVSPTNNSSWTWDKMVAILNETFDNAKKRAVEPDHFKDTGLETLLPALVADLSTTSATIPQDFGENIDYPYYGFDWDDPNEVIAYFEAPRDSNGNII